MKNNVRNGAISRTILLMTLLGLLVTALTPPVTKSVRAQSTDPLTASIEQAVLVAITELKGAAYSDNSSISITTITSDRTWAFGSVAIMSSQEEIPDGRNWLARWSGNDWEAAISYTRTFDAWLQEAPAEVLSAEDKELLASAPEVSASGEVETASISKSNLSLPFAPMQRWEFSGGPHGWNGNYYEPWSALDFAKGDGDGRVLAARGGRVSRLCNGFAYVKISHGGGWETHYYHLQNIAVSDGQIVERGQYLGNAGTAPNPGDNTTCTGYATGPHVHFAVSYNGRFQDWHGQKLGDWTFYKDDNLRAYYGRAVRGSETVWPSIDWTHHPNYMMFNYGVPWSGIDAAYPFPDGAYGVIKGDRYWYRTSPTSPWYTNTLKSSFYKSPNAVQVNVPTSNIDTAYMFPDGGYGVLKGDRYWYRPTITSNWYTNTIKSSYYRSPNAAEVGVPTSNIDAAYIFADGAAEGVIKGDRYWYRTSPTANWYTNTLKSSFYKSPNAAQVNVPIANIDTAYIFPDGSYTVIKGNRYWHRKTITSPWETSTLQSAYYP